MNKLSLSRRITFPLGLEEVSQCMDVDGVVGVRAGNGSKWNMKSSDISSELRGSGHFLGLS